MGRHGTRQKNTSHNHENLTVDIYSPACEADEKPRRYEPENTRGEREQHASDDIHQRVDDYRHSSPFLVRHRAREHGPEGTPDCKNRNGGRPLCRGMSWKHHTLGGVLVAGPGDRDRVLRETKGGRGKLLFFPVLSFVRDWTRVISKTLYPRVLNLRYYITPCDMFGVGFRRRRRWFHFKKIKKS